MDPLTIDLATLRTALDRTLQAVEAKLGSVFPVDVDYYWNVPLGGAFDPSTDPHLDMGQVSEDIASVNELATQPPDEPMAIWHECDHLAGVLRAIAKADSP